jgi:LmbE family N-acetylglucosaminyl deacetylase
MLRHLKTVLLVVLVTASPALARISPDRLAPAVKQDRILVIAPHIDDESIAAGAFIDDAVRNGATVSIAYLTAGDNNRVSAAIGDRTIQPRARDYLKEGTTRIGEAEAAIAFLSIPRTQMFFLGYPDRSLTQMLDHHDQLVIGRGTRQTRVPYPQAVTPGADYRFQSLWDDMQKVIAAVRPTIIIAPVTFDSHPDHRAAGRLADMLATSMQPRPRMMRYLVHAENFPAPFALHRRGFLRPPPQFHASTWTMYEVPLGEEQRKTKLLQVYRSQRSDPFLRLLLDAFLRRNELFIVE